MQIRTQNNVLALNFSFPQPHSSVGRRFAAWRSYFDSSYFATQQLAFSTKRHSMKHFGNWISLRIRVRSDDMQPCCDCVYIIPCDNLMYRLDNGFCICVAVCCSVLQRIAVCCSMYISYLVTTWRAGETMASVSVLQRVAACCSALQRVAVCCSVLQFACIIPRDNLTCRRDNGFCICVAVCCSVLQCVAVCCSVLPCVALCCSVLQYVYIIPRDNLTCRRDNGFWTCIAVCCSVL